MTNGSITDRYTLYSLIVRVLHALYWKVGHENKRKQIGKLRHIALRISDLQKKNHRFQQRLKRCSCIVFISDYQCVRCSASESDFCKEKHTICKYKPVNLFKSIYIDSVHFCRFLIFNFDICRLSPILSPFAPEVTHSLRGTKEEIQRFLFNCLCIVSLIFHPLPRFSLVICHNYSSQSLPQHSML